MAIISGQQKDKASGRIGYEFNLCPFGSPQFFQLLGNRCSGVGGRWLKVFWGSLVLVKEAFIRPPLAAKSSITGSFPNKESFLFLMDTPVPELSLWSWPRAGLSAQLPVQLLGSGNGIWKAGTGQPFCMLRPGSESRNWRNTQKTFLSYLPFLLLPWELWPKNENYRQTQHFCGQEKWKFTPWNEPNFAVFPSLEKGSFQCSQCSETTQGRKKVLGTLSWHTAGGSYSHAS